MVDLNEWCGVPVPDGVWDGVMEIYRASFPAAERMGEDALRTSIEAGVRRLWTLGSVDAFAIALDLATAPPWVFGEYLAVRADARSGGLGGGLLGTLRGLGRPVVLGVEDPEWGGEMAARRIRFYERHGARRVPGSESFRAPDLETPGESVPMWLLQVPADAGSELGDELGRVLMQAILSEGYGRT